MALYKEEIMKKKLVISAIAFALAGSTLAACTDGGSDHSGQAQENKAQAHDTNSLVNNQPIPGFNWSQIRQTLIDAETVSANGTITTSFFYNQGVQDPVFSCPSIGMPVPNTAQLSNPHKVVNDPYSYHSQGQVIDQMDPYGIYAPSASTGTYVICSDSHGHKYLQYWEGFVQTVSAPAVWDQTTHAVKVTGAPTFTPVTK
jgi:hypothetical protein